MASAISHAVASAGISAWFYRPAVPRRVWVAAAACAILPDADAIGYWLGVPYGSVWGHRGLTHSLCFAAGLALLVTLLADERTRTALGRPRLLALFFLVTASHGLLDACTNGGGGVAFFAPFWNHRYFMPVRPIAVSPMSVTRFFSARGARILRSEALWIWLPTAAVMLAAVLARRRRRAAA